MNLAAFDIEIAKELPEGDWEEYRPFGITCAALCFEDMTTKVITGGRGIRQYAPVLSPLTARCLVRELKSYVPITWNGASFDFKVLSDACYDLRNYNMCDVCREIALGHIDMGFQMLCEMGYMCALDGAARGLGLSGKMEGMSGEKAPAMWKQGIDAQAEVLKYVTQDVVTTMEVYRALLERGKLKWYKKNGELSKAEWRPTIKEGRLLTVRECLELPLPDTSWMDDPWPREKFTGWIYESE